jgi:hypothetical protein
MRWDGMGWHKLLQEAGMGLTQGTLYFTLLMTLTRRRAVMAVLNWCCLPFA